MRTSRPGAMPQRVLSNPAEPSASGVVAATSQASALPSSATPTASLPPATPSSSFLAFARFAARALARFSDCFRDCLPFATTRNQGGGSKLSAHPTGIALPRNTYTCPPDHSSTPKPRVPRSPSTQCFQDIPSCPRARESALSAIIDARSRFKASMTASMFPDSRAVPPRPAPERLLHCRSRRARTRSYMLPRHNAKTAFATHFPLHWPSLSPKSNTRVPVAARQSTTR